jgi:glycosyltransferase involved in cell wall biosynthesis
MVDDLKKAIASTSDLDGKLVVVEAPDDATLSALYEGCLFTLFLSYYEGWGLPVSDSLAFGKVCVASERTSMPEAGGEFCVYVDPDNTTATFERIRSLIENPGELDALEHRLQSSFRPTSWSETADEIWDAVTACASSIPARRRPVARDLVL